MNKYLLEVEIYADSAEAACRALAERPVQAVVVGVTRSNPASGLREATDSELEQELKLRNRTRLLARLREEEVSDLYRACRPGNQ